MKRNDIYLIVVVILMAIMLGLYLNHSAKQGSYVVVTVDGTEVYRLSLAEDAIREIVGYDGGSNMVKIQDGHVSMKDADCPDRVCVHTKKISKSGETIVCLPNRVVLEIISDNSSDIDAIVK